MQVCTVPLTAEPILKANAALGEGAIWNFREKVLHWVDIDNFRIHTFDPEKNTDSFITVQDSVGTVVRQSPDRGNNFVVGLSDEISLVDAKGKTTTLAKLKENPRNRCNDGKCDPAGRFWCGSFNFDNARSACNLWMLDRERQLHHKLDNVGVSNGLVWTSDAKTMYYIDSLAGHLNAFDYNNETGAITNRKNVVTNIWGGYFDGMTIDCDDNVYIALWEGGAVLKIDPRTGKMLEKIDVPGVKNVTSCAFGGKNLSTLFITSSAKDADRNLEVNAGALFSIEIPNTQGLRAFEYCG